jgi:hypothetical protein
MNTTNNPSSSSKGGFGSESSGSNPGRQDQGSRPMQGGSNPASQASGPQESASRSFTSYGSESEGNRGNRQDVERHLNAIEQSCRDLRQALGNSGGSSSDIGRSDVSDSSRTSSSRDSGRDSGRTSASR